MPRLKSIVSQSTTDRALERSPVCLGCGSEGSDTETCDQCGKQFCNDCGPYRDDDAPIDLCETCCEKYDDEDDEE